MRTSKKILMELEKIDSLLTNIYSMCRAEGNLTKTLTISEVVDRIDDRNEALKFLTFALEGDYNSAMDILREPVQEIIQEEPAPVVEEEKKPKKRGRKPKNVEGE